MPTTLEVVDAIMLKADIRRAKSNRLKAQINAVLIEQCKLKERHTALLIELSRVYK